MKISRFAFLRPRLGNLGATYDDRLRLIGKRVVDFLLVLIEHFSLGVTAEELRANIGLKSAILLQSRLNVLGGPGPARLMGPLSSLWPM